jgi:cholesterol transport system auxiliary component
MKPQMKRLRLALPIALAVALGACSLGGLMGGGKAPATLLSLTPEAPLPEQIVRSANAGDSVTIGVPVVAKDLRAVRVPVQVSPTEVAYVTNLQWVDTPDRLFQALLAETVRRITGRVVLDARQATLDPGLQVSGQLQRFGYDQATSQVIVRYDAAKSTAGGARVDTRRFEARVPASGDAATVGPALNQAANQVALEVASWIGG